MITLSVTSQQKLFWTTVVIIDFSDFVQKLFFGFKKVEVYAHGLEHIT